MGAQGVALLDFGAFPGAWDAFIDVTGQTGFVASSLCEAYLQPAVTANHSADEHRLETLRVDAVYQADGTIRIYGYSTADPPLVGDAVKIYGKWNVGWVWN